MDVGHPVGDLIPGVRGRILATLAQLETPLTVRALARYAAASPQACLLQIDDLAEVGLVTVEPAGQALMVSLNRDHVMAEPLLLLASTRGRLVQRLASELSAWPDLAGAWLFGSAARGDGDRNSDVDLLLIAARSTDTSDWADETSRLNALVRGWTGNHPQLVEHTRDSFATLVRSGNPLVASVGADGIALIPESRALLRQVMP